MSGLSYTRVQSGRKPAAVRPALVTAVAALELAAAVWDARIFLRINELFPVSLGSLSLLMPAAMCILAIYAGVGLLQMRRSGWTAWMVRHAWLGGFYLLSLPALSAQTMFCPGLSIVILWRSAILIVSAVTSLYLLAARSQFDNASAR